MTATTTMHVAIDQMTKARSKGRANSTRRIHIAEVETDRLPSTIITKSKIETWQRSHAAVVACITETRAFARLKERHATAVATQDTSSANAEHVVRLHTMVEAGIGHRTVEITSRRTAVNISRQIVAITGRRTEVITVEGVKEASVPTTQTAVVPVGNKSVG